MILCWISQRSGLNIAQYMVIQDSIGFRIPRAGFWISVPNIPDSKSWILDFNAEYSGFQEHDSGFQCQVFRIPQAKISRIPKYGLPYIGQQWTRHLDASTFWRLSMWHFNILRGPQMTAYITASFGASENTARSRTALLENKINFLFRYPASGFLGLLDYPLEVYRSWKVYFIFYFSIIQRKFTILCSRFQ